MKSAINCRIMLMPAFNWFAGGVDNAAHLSGLVSEAFVMTSLNIFS
jgi:hypothetical protein